MAFKFIALFALASVASAGHLAVAPAYAHGAYAVAAPEPAYIKSYAAPTVVKTVEYEAPAQYDFSYGVSDSLTGDHKSQAESRQGDNVHGSYSLIDSDGFKRTVEYTADEHNGFNAVVHREPLAHAVAAPVTKVISTPVAQYAPAHYAAQYAPAHHAAQYAPAHYAAQYAPAHYTAQYAPVAKVASVATPISYSSAAAPVAYSAYSTPVTKVVSQVAAPAHYAPSIVAGAGYYPGAHYAPAAYTTYGGHYAPSTYTVHSGQVYHH